MPNGSIFALILLIVAAMILLFVVKRNNVKKEEFSNENVTHDEYVQLSMKKYNPLADQYDVTRPNFAGTDDPVQLDKVTQQIKNAMTTAEIYPDANTNSRFGIAPQPINISMPPSNQILADSKKCEAIKGRSCGALNNPENRSCGICLKGGTAFSDKNSAGKHIGGLLVLPDDRAEAEAKAGQNGVPAYVATIGDCQPGYLFVKADECEKGKNRLECTEAGEAGGFDGTMKDIARSKCAQVINGDMDKYIYEPRGRRFNLNLRVITPTGCGVVHVYVTRARNNENIGSYKADTSGFEFVVPVRNVGEAEEVNVKVLEEVPHRPRGRSEVFRYEGGKAGYAETIQTSKLTCERIGARHATSAELELAQRNGMQTCGCANTTSTNGYPIQTNLPQYGVYGCGGPGINQCPTTQNSWNQGRGASWCIGIKPPGKVTNMEYHSSVSPFFSRVVAAEPENVWSQHGDDYQAPYYRAVIMQWESEDGRRSVPFEPSIVKVNGIGPSNIAQDGTMTFGNLRRLGTFTRSSMILSPRPSGSMLRNQFWIWNNQPNSQTVIFSSKIPGVFKDPFYREDLSIAPHGPLISAPETMKLLRTSPCLRDGEQPGKYSIECLTSLFRSAGGDPLRGKLATENGGLIQLLKNGDIDEISEYLSTLYTTATKGRDSMGNRVGTNSADRVKKINAASQLMFGFDLSTPCEDIIEDAAGNMQIVPKPGPYKADCLDFLWMNTGNDRQRGNEDRTRNTSLSNTYTSLWDRYSGLRSNEGSADKRTKHPFQACQRNGSKAPMNAEGNPNTAAISEANAKGNIQAIQNWYNEIHNNANFLPTSGQNNNAHKEFMKQCYGIDRVDYKPTEPDCGGVRARYVRVLATGIHGTKQSSLYSCIQIPHIEVFDSKGNEIAKGKPTSSHSVGYGGSPEKAVTGPARPHSHYEDGGEYHDDCTTPDRQFWMVDLGSTQVISKVVFYPRTDCCTQRQLQAPVQLLNESRQIVAQQPIGQTGVNKISQPQVLTFTEAMTKPKYPISSLAAGMRLTFRSAIASDRFLHHGDFAIWATSKYGPHEIWSDVHRKISTWILRPARNNVAGQFSFESIDWPNNFIRHSGFRCWLNTIGGNPVEMNDASFSIVPAVNGDPTMVSIRSANYPTYYIATKREDPTEIWITTVDTSNVWDVQRASWTIMDPRA